MSTLILGRGILRPVTRAAASAGNDELEERRLLAAARRGEREAFDRLVELHLPAVWRVAWRVVRHRQDAEDVVQETFVTAWRSLDSFRGDAKLSSWLHRIAVTRALNHLDRRAVRVERASDVLDPVAEAGALPDVAGSAPASPIESLEAAELRGRLATCIESLPAEWRAVIALRDGEGMSYGQMARTLGVAVGTVRSRLSRARLALRECLRREEGGR